MCYAVTRFCATYSDANLKKECDLETDTQERPARILRISFLKKGFLLPNNIDSVPNVPFLILLSHFEDMRFQIPNVLRE